MASDKHFVIDMPELRPDYERFLKPHAFIATVEDEIYIVAWGRDCSLGFYRVNPDGKYKAFVETYDLKTQYDTTTLTVGDFGGMPEKHDKLWVDYLIHKHFTAPLLTPKDSKGFMRLVPARDVFPDVTVRYRSEDFDDDRRISRIKMIPLERKKAGPLAILMVSNVNDALDEKISPIVDAIVLMNDKVEVDYHYMSDAIIGTDFWEYEEDDHPGISYWQFKLMSKPAQAFNERLKQFNFKPNAANQMVQRFMTSFIDLDPKRDCRPYQRGHLNAIMP